MKYTDILWATVLGGITGLIIAALILPALVTNLATTLDTLDLTGVSSLIGWIGVFVIVVVLGATSLVLTKFYRKEIMIPAFLTSFIVGVFALCLISFYWVSFLDPTLFYGLTMGDKIAKWYLDPSFLSILYGSPQLVWIISATIHIVLYNLKFKQLADSWGLY